MQSEFGCAWRTCTDVQEWAAADSGGATFEGQQLVLAVARDEEQVARIAKQWRSVDTGCVGAVPLCDRSRPGLADTGRPRCPATGAPLSSLPRLSASAPLLLITGSPELAFAEAVRGFVLGKRVRVLAARRN